MSYDRAEHSIRRRDWWRSRFVAAGGQQSVNTVQILSSFYLQQPLLPVALISGVACFCAPSSNGIGLLCALSWGQVTEGVLASMQTMIVALAGHFLDGEVLPASPLTIAILIAVTLLGCSDQIALRSPGPSGRGYPSHLSSERTVVASWYGPGFVGRSTSSGEVFNPNAMTAASKTLPLGTQVQVTNPDNGRSVVVRINDRGPFVKGRGLDLSHRAAQKIGLTGKGVGPVRIASIDGLSYRSVPEMPEGVRIVPFSYGSNSTRSTHVRRTIYRVRTGRSLKRTIVSNPVGAWLVSLLYR